MRPDPFRAGYIDDVEAATGGARRWWLAVLLGLLAVGLGVWMLANLVESVVVLALVIVILAVLFGIRAAVVGLLAIAAGWELRKPPPAPPRPPDRCGCRRLVEPSGQELDVEHHALTRAPDLRSPLVASVRVMAARSAMVEGRPSSARRTRRVMFARPDDR